MDAMYQYDNLTEPDAIRVVLLDPSPDLSSPLYCQLLPISLSRYKRDLVGKYTALSYVWGDAQRISPITIDGKMFYITASLDSALRYLRDPTRKRQIWADAICINQDNIEERNQQVGQMGSVYATAEHTVIYLGEGTPETDRLLDEMQSTADLRALYNKVETIIAIKYILRRPWFKRIWVLQELVLSRDPWIQCGTYLVKWKELENWLPRADGLFQEDGKAFFDMAYLRSEHLNALISPPKMMDLVRVAEELLELLKARRGFGAADARDVLFANVHLIVNDTKLTMMDADTHWASWKEFRLIGIDYGKTITQVYRDLTRFLIQRLCDCRILSLRGPFPGERIEEIGLPTWVVDWSLPASTDAPAFGLSCNSERSIIKDSYDFRLVFIDNPYILAFKGMLVGQIMDESTIPVPEVFDTNKSAKELFPVSDDPHGAWKFLKLTYQHTYQQWKHFLGPSRDPMRILDLIEVDWYHENALDVERPWSDALQILPSRLLAQLSGGECGNDKLLAKTIPCMWNWIRTSFNEILLGEPTTATEYMFSSDIDLTQQECLLTHLVVSRLTAKDNIVRSRKLAVLDTDFLALVPAETCIGDSVAILPQHSFPVVLRSLQHDLEPTLNDEVGDELDFSKEIWDMSENCLHRLDSPMNFLVYSENATIQHYYFVGDCFVEGMMFDSALEKRVRKHIDDIRNGLVDVFDEEQPPFQPMNFALH